MTASRYAPGEAGILAPPRSAADLEREEAPAAAPPPGEQGPLRQCTVCERRSSEAEGSPCRMPQPSGDRCPGVLLELSPAPAAQQAPAAGYEARPHRWAAGHLYGPVECQDCPAVAPSATPCPGPSPASALDALLESGEASDPGVLANEAEGRGWTTAAAALREQAPAPAAEPLKLDRLLTPAARLALAAELLEPLGLATISILSPPAFDELVAGHEQSICERLEGQTYVRSGLVQLGKVQVHLYSGRPATLDDARRLLEGEG